jgi:hypothetical protein
MYHLFVSIRAAACAITLIGLGACGGKAPEGESSAKPAAGAETASAAETPPSAGTAQATDVCTLLSDEEFQQSTGYAVASKKTLPGAGKFFAPGCEWELKSSPQGLHRMTINVQTQDGRERFKLVSPSMAAVPDVGDEAVKNGGNTEGTFWAVKGDTLVTLRYALPVTTTDPDPLVVPLLKLVVSRQ